MSDEHDEPLRISGTARGIESEAAGVTRDLAYVDAWIDLAGGQTIAAARRLRFEVHTADGQRVICDATHATPAPAHRLEGTCGGLEDNELVRLFAERLPAPHTRIVVMGAAISEGERVVVDGVVDQWRPSVGTGGPREAPRRSPSHVRAHRVGWGADPERALEDAKRAAEAASRADANASERDAALAAAAERGVEALQSGGQLVRQGIPAALVVVALVLPLLTVLTPLAMLATSMLSTTLVAAAAALVCLRSGAAVTPEDDDKQSVRFSLVFTAGLFGIPNYVMCLRGVNGLQFVWAGCLCVLAVTAWLVVLHMRGAYPLVRAAWSATPFAQAASGAWVWRAGRGAPSEQDVDLSRAQSSGFGSGFLAIGRRDGSRLKAFFLHRGDSRGALLVIGLLSAFSLASAVAVPIVGALASVLLADWLPPLFWPDSD